MQFLNYIADNFPVLTQPASEKDINQQADEQQNTPLYPSSVNVNDGPLLQNPPTIATYEKRAGDDIQAAEGNEKKGNELLKGAQLEPASEAWGAAGAQRQAAAGEFTSAGNQYSRNKDFFNAAKEFTKAGDQNSRAASDFEIAATLDFHVAAGAANPATAKDERNEAEDELSSAADNHQKAAQNYANAAKALEKLGNNIAAKQLHQSAANEYRLEYRDRQQLTRDYSADGKNQQALDEAKASGQANDNALREGKLAR